MWRLIFFSFSYTRAEFVVAHECFRILLDNNRIMLDDIHSVSNPTGRIRIKKKNLLTCMTRNLVRRSGSRLFSLDKIISNMSPWSFSMTTNTCSGVSNIHSRLTMPGWCSFCQAEHHVRSLFLAGLSCRRLDVFYLENRHLVPQLTLLLGWKSHLINDFDCHVSATLSVFTCIIQRRSVLDLCIILVWQETFWGWESSHLHKRFQTAPSRGRHLRKSDTLNWCPKQEKDLNLVSKDPAFLVNIYHSSLK